MEIFLIEFWQNIYSHFNPVAFEIFSIKIHWYGIMYVLALVSAYFFAKWIVKKDNLPISGEMIDDYFFWVEIGVILGARLGYVIFYSDHTAYYLANPLQIFNPFNGGQFVGISGMSYHGALFGFVVASTLFANKHDISLKFLLDLSAISVPIGYIFGRIGNFLNQELVGRETDVAWGIKVYDSTRHPSQLYEAILEGLVLFLFLYWYRTKSKLSGELAMLYGLGYGMARFIAELWREPDIQLGFILFEKVTMGQIMSIVMIIISSIALAILYKNSSEKSYWNKIN
jgi:phosphatidylglycerol:prolipoprotein diacylglycerol transferase